jgi:hypothetical protein
MKPLGRNITINRDEKEEERVGRLVGEVSDQKLILPLELTSKAQRKGITRNSLRDTSRRSTVDQKILLVCHNKKTHFHPPNTHIKHLTQSTVLTHVRFCTVDDSLPTPKSLKFHDLLYFFNLLLFSASHRES